jgi:hypothetical protein
VAISRGLAGPATGSWRMGVEKFSTLRGKNLYPDEQMEYSLSKS